MGLLVFVCAADVVVRLYCILIGFLFIWTESRVPSSRLAQ